MLVKTDIVNKLIGKQAKLSTIFRIKCLKTFPYSQAAIQLAIIDISMSILTTPIQT